MVGQLTSLAITIAAFLFFMSLPFSESDAGRALRRAAGFTFVMAFTPAIVVCILRPLFYEVVHGSRSILAMSELVLAIIGLGVILVVLALAAYGFSDLRSRGRSQPSSHAESIRYTKRRPENSGHHEASREGSE